LDFLAVSDSYCRIVCHGPEYFSIRKVPAPILGSSFAALTWPLIGDLIEISFFIRLSEPIEADSSESYQRHKNKGKKEVSDGRPYLGVFGLGC
jgi:hypothetical protein